MCSLIPSNFTEWMLLLTAIGTITLAVIAGLALNRFLSQEALKTQMEIVIQLVKDLASVEIQITLRMPGSRETNPKEYKFNVFQIATIPSSAEEQKYNLVYMRNEILHFFQEALRHLGNPLLPAKISESLFTLKRLGTSTENKKTWDTKPYWIVGGYEIDHYLNSINSVYTIADNMKGLQKVCILLKESIIQWFEDHRVKDINHIALMKMTD